MQKVSGSGVSCPFFIELAKGFKKTGKLANILILETSIKFKP